MITLTRPEARYILEVAQRPIKGGLPFDLSDALGDRITKIKEASAMTDKEGNTLDTDTIEVDFELFPKSLLRSSGIKFGQEWFTGAMRKMFFEDEQ